MNDIDYRHLHITNKCAYASLVNNLMIGGSKSKPKSEQISRTTVSACNKKNAIFMMCIINELYVIGACIVSYCHRKLLNSCNLKNSIDLVIMCDSKIYDKFHDLLALPIFFDRVEKIDIRHFEDSPKYKYAKHKYSSWMGASLNKWQILQYDEYDKIMFADIALLPVDAKLYDLFSKKTPGFFMREPVIDVNACTNGNTITDKNRHHVYDTNSNISYNDYLANSERYGTAHGFIMMLSPSKAMYEKYVKMTDDIYKDGIHSIYDSGPDETSIFYFYMKENVDRYDICHENATIPWDEPNLINYSTAYEFSTLFKPWIKPKVMSWHEEMLWRDIYELIVTKNINYDLNKLKSVFKTTMIDTYKKYVESDNRTKRKNYNGKYVDKYNNEFNSLNTISDLDRLFDALMTIDKKIFVTYYGPLRTHKLMAVLKD